MNTLGRVLTESVICLQSRQIDLARRSVEELLSHALAIRRTDLYLQFDRLLLEEELVKIRHWMERLFTGEPLEYILGVVDFYGCKIKVDRRVLIPRLETEIFVEEIAKRMVAPVSAWDICTGSGCIGISLKKKFPSLAVSLSDQSVDALEVARENARLNGVNVEILQGDLLSPFQGRKTDLVAVNPPYVSAKEYFSLDPSVRDFEPGMALLGGESGVEFYERLACALPLFLNSGAQVFMEISSAQGDAVQKIFSSSLWKNQRVFPDWSGKSRFFFLEKE